MEQNALVIEDAFGTTLGFLTPSGILWMQPLWPEKI